MLALITGASSGLGRDFARQLSAKGYDIIAVAQDLEKLNTLKGELKTNVQVISKDLSIRENVVELYNLVKEQDIDIVINNAGFGVFGSFVDTNLDKELNMIDVNVCAVHILTKLFLQDFKKKNKGYILNVASSAAFEPGPLMASYYASKAYVLRLTQAIAEELRRSKSSVYVGALCPGPVETNFNNVAGVRFTLKSLKSKDVVSYAIKKMFKRKLVIVPGVIMKMTRLTTKILPEKLITRIAYNIQKSKKK
ncbi:MAG: SDR family oxidoreductase [Clostridia bacterium]|nr:SDR family oxidoreductase [Clostridia bacterium]